MVVKNEAEFLERCLNSILPVVQEVILVDTGSCDDTLQVASHFNIRISKFPWQNDFSVARNFSLSLATLPWILGWNLFFAKGCNRGVQAAKGEYVLQLTNDTIVKPRWLEGLLEAITRDPKIGILENKQLFPSSNPVYANLIWHLGVEITEEKDPWHI